MKPPAGYTKLSAGVVCKCPFMWIDEDECWCCNGRGATNNDPAMVVARTIVEDHIAEYGMIPHPDKLKEAFAAKISDGLLALRPREIERLRAEIAQCSLELGEAAKLLQPHYPRTAGIYEEACGRARTAIGLTPCETEQPNSQ